MPGSWLLFLKASGLRSKVELKQVRVEFAQPRPVLKETGFENPRLARLGVEVISFSYMYNRTTPGVLCLPERVRFFMLMLVTRGSGRHTVDCVTSPIGTDSLVLVRPGQVQQWHVDSRYVSQMVLIDPVALRPGFAPLAEFAQLDGCPACIRLSGASARQLASEVRALRGEIRGFDGSDLAAALIRQMLLVMLLRVVRWRRAEAGVDAGRSTRRSTHQMFLQELEARYRRQHRVHYYAHRLGYSVSTLNRVCGAAEGRSAKAVIDRRIALEAQRLLLHSRANLAAIGHQLGFSEAGNFVKFYTRVVGRAPATLRS